MHRQNSHRWAGQLQSSTVEQMMFNIYLYSANLHVRDQMRSYKLRLILRREENRRTQRKTLEARERPTTTTLLT